MKFGKKGIITFLAAALAMVFASGALAADVATSADLAKALIAGGEIKLTGDITTTGLFSVQKDAMIDLNGHKITRERDVVGATPVFYVTEGTLAVDDTVGGGEIVSKNNAGTAEAIRVYAGDASKKPNAILNKVKLSSDGFGVVIMGNSEAGETAEKVSFLASVIINSSAEVYGTSTGVLLEGKGATLEVNGATIKSEAFAISGNGTWKGDKNKGGTSITITSGKIESEKDLAIYHPQDGILNISGGTITGTDGIQLKAGGAAITNVSGGTIKATGDFVEALTDSSNGSVATGSAISLIGNSGYAGNISLNISGAGVEIISEKGYAVRQEITKGEASQVSSVKISAGTIKGAEGALYFGNYDKDTYSLTGGSYSSDPSDYVDKAISTIVEKDGLFTVKGKAAPIVTPVEPKLPDGTSDDVTAEIKPATAVVLGVDTTKSAITEETKAAAITETMKVISADITSKDLTVNEETGAVEISVATASEAAKGLLKDNETLASKDIAPLPVFTAKVDEGKTAMVSYQLTSSALKAKTAEEVRVMKILSSTTAGEFKYASEITADMDGKFTIQKADGKTIHSGALEAGTDYLLTLFIKDGSSFDLDGAKDGSITDPAAIFSTTTTEPQHGSSSSGCNGGFGALALLGLALVPMFYGKKR
ncbi:SYNERG-CTERM sorting domain-containing protein [Cloacibacillus evryensis]|uniref:SYNERG-CTERM sorting domain-containing protein n=1 Tax=Cloacibacillus evryensis TaxID=508460 RepID=A0AAW5KB27_9BACT|nr:Synerg-CTERM sorting domain-containing protein [Cloacibacillus evryensis]MCQ4815733.1 SYNERG-CTERM sorting domain-containing protein [Cloacibacillus evryensis]